MKTLGKKPWAGQDNIPVSAKKKYKLRHYWCHYPTLTLQTHRQSKLIAGWKLTGCCQVEPWPWATLNLHALPRCSPVPRWLPWPCSKRWICITYPHVALFHADCPGREQPWTCMPYPEVALFPADSFPAGPKACSSHYSGNVVSGEWQSLSHKPREQAGRDGCPAFLCAMEGHRSTAAGPRPHTDPRPVQT